jgi:osmotically-inducible protein OsmY
MAIEKDLSMNTRTAAAIASLLIAPFCTGAFAQGAQQTAPEMPPPATTAEYAGAPPAAANANDTVAGEVKNALQAHGISTDDITVTFQNGTATISGSVSSEADVTSATKIAMHVNGVKQVDVSGLHPSSSADED